MANAIFSLFGMTRVSHHVNFPKVALSKGGRGQGAVAAPAALHAVRTPRAVVGTRAGTGCVCVSVLDRGERGKKVAGGRKEKEIIFEKFYSLPGLQEGQGLRCAEGRRVMVYQKALTAPLQHVSAQGLHRLP